MHTSRLAGWVDFDVALPFDCGNARWCVLCIGLCCQFGAQCVDSPLFALSHSVCQDNPYNNFGSVAHWAVFTRHWKLLRDLASLGAVDFDVSRQRHALLGVTCLNRLCCCHEREAKALFGVALAG